jgi:hypothetical protein
MAGESWTRADIEELLGSVKLIGALISFQNDWFLLGMVIMVFVVWDLWEGLKRAVEQEKEKHSNERGK